MPGHAKMVFFILPPKAFAFQASFLEDPVFVEILERQRERQAIERRKVLDVVCDDNPYAEIWQPMVETCQQFL